MSLQVIRTVYKVNYRSLQVTRTVYKVNYRSFINKTAYFQLQQEYLFHMLEQFSALADMNFI